MRIVVDLQSCQSGSRLGGIGRYSLELAKAMARQTGSHEMWIALNSVLPTAIAETRHAFSDLIPQDHIRVFDTPPSIAELNNNKAKVRAAELIREEYIRSLKPDMVHISSLFEGLQEDVITSVGKIFPANRTAVTLYDLIPLVQRERYLSNNEALNHYLGKIENLKKAGLLLSISDFSRQEAIDVLNINPENIVNISSAADNRFQPLVIPKKQSVTLLEKYGIRRKFLMYTGSFDQRKNHANLIEAFGLLPKAVRKNYQLVIVGNGWDAIYKQLQAIAKKAGLHRDELVFAGHVSDEDLLPLYNLCHLFVFPSLAEGFGLPVLEAMSCGTPTIGSNCTSIPEVLGWSEAQFDPRSPKSIAKKINQALTDTGFLNALRVSGLKQAKKFSWDESAKIAIGAFESHSKTILNHGSKSSKIKSKTTENDENNDLIQKIADLDGISDLPDGALQEMAQSIASNRYQAETLLTISQGKTLDLKTGWVTTWNTRCGIASYSQFLIENFHANTTIFAPESNAIMQPDEPNVIRCWQAGKKDNLHRLIQEIKRSRLDALIIQFNYSFFDFPAFALFLQEMVACGIRVSVTFHSTFDPSDDKRLVSIKDALALCHNLIVHSMEDITILRSLGLAHNVNFMPQGIIEKQPILQTSLDFKNRKVIATYGFALPSKGLVEIIQAFSKLLQEDNQHFHLLMVNAEYPDPISSSLINEIHKLIENLNIKEYVTFITDYLPDEVSLGYLRLADLIVYGYQATGESSSAAVRMGIAAKRPVAVTPSKIFNDVKSAVFFLPGFSSDDIATGIRSILDLNESNDAVAVKVSNGARLWTSAHLYSAISRHLLWLVTRPKLVQMNYVLPISYTLNQSSEKLNFVGSGPELKSIVGKVSGDRILTTGKQGALIYGPFISVAPGQYLAIIHGSAEASHVNGATVDVAINTGASILAKVPIAQSSEQNVLAELTFSVPEGGCTDLEIRVLVGDDSNLEVSKIEVSPQLSAD